VDKVSPLQLEAAFAAPSSPVQVENEDKTPPYIVGQARPSSSSVASCCCANVMGRSRPSSARRHLAPPGRGLNTELAVGSKPPHGGSLLSMAWAGSILCRPQHVLHHLPLCRH
jgi:hypothetical protein